jgi:hypothetical protein
MTENTSNTDPIDLSETYCYTYEVVMVIQILAPNKDIADLKLDKDGGYVSKRTVNFKDSVFLYKDEDKNKTEDK